MAASRPLGPGFCRVAPGSPTMSHLGVLREQHTGSASLIWMPASSTLLLVAVVSPGDSFPLLLAQRGRRPSLAVEKRFGGG